MLIYTYTIEKKGIEMNVFYKIVVVVFALQVLAASIGLARAQVYVPGPGYPLCFPQIVATPQGPVTIVVCQ